VYETTNGVKVSNGDVLIAAITSCTNTSNPSVMLAAGLLAKKAVEAGLKVAPHIKLRWLPARASSTEYLTAAGLLPYLEKLGFGVTAYGCTTCIGNAGDLTPELNAAIATHDIVARRRCRVTATSKRAFTRTSARTSSLRHRWSSPTPSPAT